MSPSHGRFRAPAPPAPAELGEARRGRGGPPPGLIILVGFMGAGKSSVGRLLARRLGRCFVETDDIITSLAGQPIPDLFRERGEAAFRELEAEAVESLKLKRGDVVATGGGLPCYPGRMDTLKALGPVVWLKAGFAEMYERARRGGGRPMLAGKTQDEVEALYRGRVASYAQATLTVDTAGLSVDQAVARLGSALRADGGARA